MDRKYVSIGAVIFSLLSMILFQHHKIDTVERLLAAPPGSPYNPGETLAPTCAPGDANCTVNAPIQAGTNDGVLVGIGPQAPTELFELSGNGDADLDIYTANTTNSDHSTIHVHNSRGTLTVPLISQNGDSISTWEGLGYDGAAFGEVAYIDFQVDGTPGIGDMPGRINFATSDDGTTNTTVRMTINSAGNVGIGTTAQDARLELDTDQTGFPDGWAENLQLTSQEYPSLWLHAESDNEGFLIGADEGDGLWIGTTDGTSFGDYLFAILENGFVGIGTTTPGELLEIGADNDADFDIYSANNTNSDWSDITIYGSRGTLAAPLISQDGDDIAALNIFGHDGGGYEPLASIDFVVDGTPGVDDMPGRIEFATTEDGDDSTTARVTIDNAGFVGIGTTDPEANLHLWGDGTNGANASLWFGDNENLYIREFGTGDSDELHVFGDSGVYLDTDGEFIAVNDPNLDDEEFIITDDGSSDTAIILENTNSGSDHVYEIHVEDDDTFIIYENENEDHTESILEYDGTNNHIGFSGAEAVAGVFWNVDNGATLTNGGVWTDASSRDLKTGIGSLSYQEAAEVLSQLDPVHFEYKAEPGEQYLGFIAEDVPDLVANHNRKGLAAMDIVAVLVEVNQEQQRRIDQLELRIGELELQLN